MKYAIRSKEVIFATHEIEYENRKRLLFSEEEKENFVNVLEERNINYTITSIDPPTEAQKDAVEALRTWDMRKVKEKLEEVAE